MLRIILLMLLAAVAWFGWGKYEQSVRAERAAESAARQAATKTPLPVAKAGEAGVSFFTCDGRNTCKQMTSCEEAKYFIKTCPGFNSGVFGEEANCEQHWCKK